MDLARTASAAARDAAAAAVGATPIRLHTRAAPIEYDVEGLDTEKLVYRLGTLAAAMATVPWMLSDAVLKRHLGDGPDSSRGRLTLGLSLLGVAGVTWGQVSAWPVVGRLGALIPEPAATGMARMVADHSPTRGRRPMPAEAPLPPRELASELAPAPAPAPQPSPPPPAMPAVPTSARPARLKPTRKRSPSPTADAAERQRSPPPRRPVPERPAAGAEMPEPAPEPAGLPASAPQRVEARVGGAHRPRVPRPRAVAGRSGTPTARASANASEPAKATAGPSRRTLARQPAEPSGKGDAPSPQPTPLYPLASDVEAAVEAALEADDRPSQQPLDKRRRRAYDEPEEEEEEEGDVGVDGVEQVEALLQQLAELKCAPPSRPCRAVVAVLVCAHSDGR